jgi:hypothetical protein
MLWQVAIGDWRKDMGQSGNKGKLSFSDVLITIVRMLIRITTPLHELRNIIVYNHSTEVLDIYTIKAKLHVSSIKNRKEEPL